MKILHVLVIMIILALTNATFAGGKIKTIANSNQIRLENKGGSGRLEGKGSNGRLEGKGGTGRLEGKISNGRLEGKGHKTTDLQAKHNAAFHKGK